VITGGDTGTAAPDRCAAEAEELLARHASARGVRRPPVDVGDIAAWLGFRVVLLREAPDACSAIVSLHERLIGVNALHHPRRRRFSIGHELGHIVLGHPPESRCTYAAIAACNTEADRFASALLMPADWMRRAVDRRLPLATVAATFDVSEEAARRRIASLETPRRG
jgi:predicted transcriptional regulator